MCRLAILHTHLHELLATHRRRNPPAEPERSPNGALLPTPSQAVGQTLAALAAGQKTPAFPHLQLHGDPTTGKVWVSRSCPRPSPPLRQPALPSEPWLAGQPPGVLRTLAVLTDEAVWQGRPETVASLLAAFPPDILQQRLTHPVRERWRLTAQWAAQTAHPAPTPAFHSLSSDLWTHLSAHTHNYLPPPPSNPGAQLLIHAHALPEILRQLSDPGDRGAIIAALHSPQTPWESAMQRSGIVEAATHLAQWLTNCDPHPQPITIRLTFQTWTPRLLTRLENLITGSPAEARFHQTLAHLAQTLHDHLTAQTIPEGQPGDRLRTFYRQLWEDDANDQRLVSVTGKTPPATQLPDGATRLPTLLVSRLAWLETLDTARRHWAATLLTHLAGPTQSPPAQPDPALTMLGSLLPILRMSDPRWRHLWEQLCATPGAPETRGQLSRMAEELLNHPTRPDTTQLRAQLAGWLSPPANQPDASCHPDQMAIHRWLSAERPLRPPLAGYHHPLQPYL